jgi:hypothetical protein
MTTIVQYFVRAMARAGGASGWQVAAVRAIHNLLMSRQGPSDCTVCSPAVAVEAVEAGVVPVLLGYLVSSGHLHDEFVQSGAAMALGGLSLSLGLGSPASSRQLPERMRGALQPALAALVGLLRSTQLPAVAAAALGTLANIALVDKALAAEAAAAGAALLAAQWSLRPGAFFEVVHAAEGLLEKLAFQHNAVPAGVLTPQPSSSTPESAGPGQGGSGGKQVPCCAACGAASTADGKPIKICSACRGLSYCSGACQKRH